MGASGKLYIGVFTSVALVVVALVGAQSFLARNGSNPGVSPVSPTYTINGLTCPVPSDYSSDSSVIHLLPLVTSTPAFRI